MRQWLKLNRMRGGVCGRVLKMAIRTKYLILHHTVLILVRSCIFLWSKNPFVKVLRKSNYCIRKNGRLNQNWRRAFEFNTHVHWIGIFNAIIIKTVIGSTHSRNFSFLNQSVWPWQPILYYTERRNWNVQGSMHFHSLYISIGAF